MGLADFTNSIITKDQFSGTFRKFDASVQGSARGLDKLGGVISGGGLGMLFGGMAGAAGAIAIGKMAWSLGDVGKVAITTERSFNNLMQSVGISTSIIDQYAAAADGTIAKTDLMRMANVALAGTTGDLSSEMARLLPTLIEGARAASALNPAMGDATFMLQSLITGVKRGSPMLIDNTGIVLKLGEANEAMARRVGKSVDALSAQEKSLAILYATADAVPTLVGQVGDAMDETATSSAQLKTAWQEMREELGKKIAPFRVDFETGAADFLTSVNMLIAGTEQGAAARAMMLEQSGQMLQTLREEGSFTQQLGATVLTYANAIVQSGDALSSARKELARYVEIELVAAGATDEHRERLQNLITIYLDGSISTEQFVASTRLVVASATDAGTAATIAAANIGTLTFSLRQAKEAAQGLGGSLGGLPKEYKAGLDSAFGQVYGMGSAIPAGEADAMYSSYARQYAQLELDKTSISRAEYRRRKADLDAALNDQIGSYRKFSSAASSSVSDIGNAYDDIKSKIGTALTPTFDLSGLTGGALGGVGGDAFDEAYKRLAAVALRPEELQIHAGDWASTFEQAGLTGLTPEEAQARAKELVEAYSKGLDFSLIDREAIKDSVRQAIRAEELYNTIVDEIYAEMGKEKPKLAQAGTNIGNQLNRAATATVQSGAAAYVGAWLDVLEPGMIARLDARYRRTGQAQ
ncbi:MAG: hypothetical protein IPM41_06350 [Sphingomonadales bacterium]|nr:hypothetical protein [Sphingomonadales bacterium]